MQQLGTLQAEQKLIRLKASFGGPGGVFCGPGVGFGGSGGFGGPGGGLGVASSGKPLLLQLHRNPPPGSPKPPPGQPTLAI